MSIAQYQELSTRINEQERQIELLSEALEALKAQIQTPGPVIYTPDPLSAEQLKRGPGRPRKEVS